MMGLNNQDEPRPVPVRDLLLLAQAGAGLLNGAAHLVREVREMRREHTKSKPAHFRRGRKMQTITLYRPVGQQEIDLIAGAEYRAFPPRLPQQPIFYPVLNAEYATEIARDWNPRDPHSGFVGYVTRFDVRADFLKAYTVQTVDANRHQEYWIPAGDLPSFNAALVGPIEVIATFRGAAIAGA